MTNILPIVPHTRLSPFFVFASCFYLFVYARVCFYVFIVSFSLFYMPVVIVFIILRIGWMTPCLPIAPHTRLPPLCLLPLLPLLHIPPLPHAHNHAPLIYSSSNSNNNSKHPRLKLCCCWDVWMTTQVFHSIPLTIRFHSSFLDPTPLPQQSVSPLPPLAFARSLIRSRKTTTSATKYP